MPGRIKVLLDTSYFLPVFGIAVKGLEVGDLLAIRRHALQGTISLYYASFMWLELLPKVYREARKRGVDVENIVEKAVKSILKADYLKPVDADEHALMTAYKMRCLGHRDMIDNLLYGIASSKDMILVTMDVTLVDFLKKHGLSEAKVMSHKELLTMLEST